MLIPSDNVVENGGDSGDKEATEIGRCLDIGEIDAGSPSLEAKPLLTDHSSECCPLLCVTG